MQQKNKKKKGDGMNFMEKMYNKALIKQVSTRNKDYRL